MLAAAAVFAAPTKRPTTSKTAVPSFQQPLVDPLPGSPARLTEAHIAAVRGDARAQWHNAARMERRSHSSQPHDEERDDPPPEPPPAEQPASDASKEGDATPAAAEEGETEGGNEKSQTTDSPFHELASTAGATAAGLWMASHPWAVMPMIWGGMWYPMHQTGGDPLGVAPPSSVSSFTDD